MGTARPGMERGWLSKDVSWRRPRYFVKWNGQDLVDRVQGVLGYNWRADTKLDSPALSKELVVL